jgi:glycosyltransferase involved in cell wall biosynthesis
MLAGGTLRTYESKSRYVKPKLTLITPVYNAENTISRAILSSLQILNSNKVDASLIVVDDGSTDKTVSVAQEFEGLHDRITLIKSPKNQGPGGARNSALRLIEGGYVGFLDSDDELIADAYLKSFFDGVSNDADLITFRGGVYNGCEIQDRYDFSRLTTDKSKIAKMCLRGELDGSVIFSIYHTDLISKNDIQFGNLYYEDITFNYSSLLCSNSFFISNNIAYKKINRSDSIVNSISKKHIMGMMSACFSIRDLIFNRGQISSEFFEDYSYGLHGYVGFLIENILSMNKPTDEASLLFRALYAEICNENFLMRNSTLKDRYVHYLLNSFQFSNVERAIADLKGLRNEC